MSLSLGHQIGALTGTPIPLDIGGTTSGESTSTIAASAVWKAPTTNMICKVQKPETVDALSPPLSPCRSPVLGGIRPDLSVACRAFATDVEAPLVDFPGTLEDAPVREYKEGTSHDKGQGVPVYVMLPLDSVTTNNTVNRKKAMNASLQALKSAGVEGIMMDVWWGLVERDSPGQYNWSGYNELLEMAKKHGLKVQAVMSFHQCGGNVGDSCT